MLFMKKNLCYNSSQKTNGYYKKTLNKFECFFVLSCIISPQIKQDKLANQKILGKRRLCCNLDKVELGNSRNLEQEY